MRLSGIVWLFLFSIFGLSAQDAEPGGLKDASVEMELDSGSFFTDMAVSIRFEFPEVVTEVPGTGDSHSQIAVLSIEVLEDEGKSEATVRLMPRQTGVVVIPPFEFQSETTLYRSLSRQILVSEPSVSDAMSFSMVPAKRSVYEGEPLRIDVTWTADFETNQIRSLHCFPELFSRQDARIVIPRCTAPEEEQIGLPFGGRRIVGHRLVPKNEDGEPTGKFGSVTFPIYVKFDEPGKVVLPPTRLEIAHLKAPGDALAPYAVFFNNGLFEPRTALEAFDRYYAEIPAETIEVRALPVENRSEYFSGLFTPVSISVSLQQSQIEVGEVIEADIVVHSEAPHGMLELPELGVQRSLRAGFRAGSEYGRTWLENGTGFLGRIRALSADVTAFPSLKFQVFDPDSGQYRSIQTEAQPLTVNPRDGQRFFDMRSLAPESTFTNQPEGVWQNAKPDTMSDLINSIIGLLADYLWLWLLPGPIAYFILLPKVKEWRKRATDETYRRQAEAYEAFSKIPEGTTAKWEAFVSFLATGFAMPGSAWTPGDSASRLRKIGVDPADIDLILSTHEKMDAADFSTRKTGDELPGLDGLAARLFDSFKKMTMLILAVGLLFPAISSATDWDEAEVLFEKAIASPPGESVTESLYTQAALKFEASANGGSRRGASWFNAGNAWFKAGEMGRAISCYRQARIYRPFDETIADNLLAARALAVDVVDDSGEFSVKTIPVRWLCAMLVIGTWFFVGVLLLHIRYRSWISLAGVVAISIGLLSILVTTWTAAAHSGKEGVVVVGSIYGRKGPAYSYERAFNEPLHDGLEFEILEERKQWLQVLIGGNKKCWIPADQVRLIRNTRS
ncbi:MAG: hypothetical protein P1U89_04915 [Verrucomicrobiales bacterium]|nr:hypothetical protein [Verrucomicrobiales bacterium]